MNDRQQNTTTYPITWTFVQSSDHISSATGVAPITMVASKNGGALYTPSGTISEVGSGVYALSGNVYDRNTLGEWAFYVSAPGADPVNKSYTIVPWNPFDGNLALTNLAALSFTGSLVNAFIGVSGISQSSFNQMSELSSVPTFPTDPLTMLLWMFERSHNTTKTNAGVDYVYKSNGTTPLGSSILTDDGVTFTRAVYQ